MSKRWLGLCAVVTGLSLAAAVSADDGTAARFDQHRLVMVQLNTPAEIDTMLAISPDHWSDGIGLGTFPFRVPPERMDLLRQSGLTFSVQHENIQELIERQLAPSGGDGRGWFDAYKTLAEINQRLDEFVALEPELVTKYPVGTSIENRTIYGITISSSVGGPNKPAVLFNGTQHAREWISPMVVMYIADRLILGYDTDPTIKAMVDQVNFYIVPVINPDGYEHTWTTYRLWRKNRRLNAGGSYGVDLNRNWGYHWGGAGSSGDPTSDTYRGTAPFSEPETQALRDFMIAHPDIVSHIDFHSYSQLILWPFGYDYVTPPEPTGSVFAGLGNDMADAILGVHNMPYTPQPSYALYLASGVIIDWAYADQNIWSYTIELRDTGQTGFLLPPEQILPTAEENFAAARVMAEFTLTPLRFEFPAGLPATLTPATAMAIPVNLIEIGGTLAPGSGKLRYRFGGGAFAESSLVPQGGSAYQATIPALACGGVLEYYFVAESTTGAVVKSPPDAPATLYSAAVQPSLEVFSDDMETDKGWVAGAPGDTATTGIWNRMDPEGTAAQPEDDHTLPPGVICWVTDGHAGNTLGQFDVDGGRTTLVSPTFDGSQGVSAVSYWRWYSNDKGSSPNADVFTVKISNDNGGTFVTAEVVGPGGPQASGGWYYHEFVINSLLPPTSTMKMHFIAADEGAGSIVEAAVDDFRVVAQTECPLKLADLNCDGAINAFDIDPFVLALTDPTGYATAFPGCNLKNADCNQDGVINAFDIDPFVDLLTP